MKIIPACAPKNTWKGTLVEWLVVPLVGGFVIGFFFAQNDLASGNYSGFLESAIISSVFWVVLGNGNGAIVHLIDQRWTWLETPIKRTIIGLIGMFVYTLVASTMIIYMYVELYFGASFIAVVEAEGMLSLLKVPLSITVVVALWFHGRSFLMAWRQSAIDVERLKNENLKSKFESLRSQVNPHFLFNSLNALSSLVYDDQGKAVDFIQKLSEVYRYVLDHQNDEVVDLNLEVAFLKSFVYLNKIRFGENFDVDYSNLEESNENWSVPPVALQMLLENCIKHNEVSNEHPLKIEISKKGDLITVENNLNPINVPKQDSNGLGLSNIISRYEMLSDQKVEVTETEDSFRVSIPLLKFE
ncbi:MAG: hypothetical protein GY816_16575 [Cytophagales bacterium]|nr:hypothetical protein [Cytophagales bacterium]